MGAAVIQHHGGPEVMSCEDVPDPVCADDGLVIEVQTVSIEGGDLRARLMTLPTRPSKPASKSTSLPALAAPRATPSIKASRVKPKRCTSTGLCSLSSTRVWEPSMA